MSGFDVDFLLILLGIAIMVAYARKKEVALGD